MANGPTPLERPRPGLTPPEANRKLSPYAQGVRANLNRGGPMVPGLTIKPAEGGPLSPVARKALETRAAQLQENRAEPETTQAEVDEGETTPLSPHTRRVLEAQRERLAQSESTAEETAE